MYCIKCGKQIEDGAKFCRFCGAKAYEGTKEKETPVVAVETVRTEVKADFAGVKDNSFDNKNKAPKERVAKPNEEVAIKSSAKVAKDSEGKAKKSYTFAIVMASIAAILIIAVGGLIAYMIINDLTIDFNRLMNAENPFVSSTASTENEDDIIEELNDGDTISFADDETVDDSDENTATSDEIRKSNDVSENLELAQDGQEEAIEAQEEAIETESREDIWPSDARGTYYDCADKIPFEIDSNIWTMTVDEFESYTGIDMVKGKENDNRYSFPSMKTELKGTKINSDSYLVVDADEKVCMLHFEYISDFEDDLKKLVELDKKMLSSVDEECINTGEYIYYGSLPIISYSSWEGTDYRANAYERKITYCREDYFISEDNSEAVDVFMSELDMISNQISVLDESDKMEGIKVDIEGECAKIDRQRTEIQNNLGSYNYYENGLVSWYLKKEVPVYIHSMKGYHDIGYDIMYIGEDLSYAQVVEDGIKYEYYFSGDQLIRVVDCFGEVYDYGSKQWTRYSDKVDLMIYERGLFKVTIPMAMEALR